MSSSLPTSLKLFLKYDDYDYDLNSISATTLMQPTQMIVLASRIQEASIEDVEIDITDESLLAKHPTAIGTACHDRLEKAIKSPNLSEELMKLGYPRMVAENIEVNPEEDHDYAVWCEIRRTKVIEGKSISGKPDVIWLGQLQDMKNVKAYTYCKNDPYPYIFQGSIYKWLFPDEVKEDTVEILFNILDWNAKDAYQDNYPPEKALSKKYPLWSLEETTKVIKEKLFDVERYMDVHPDDLPECTDYDLWANPPVYKYYANPENITGRCTKRFDDIASANAHRASKGKGIVITTPSEVRRCNYCDAAPLCSQRKRLISEGRLKEKN